VQVKTYRIAIFAKERGFPSSCLCGNSSGRNHNPRVLDLDLEALPGFEAGVFEPASRELEPGDERRVGAAFERVGLPAARLLNRDAAQGQGSKCFKIGVSHINSSPSWWWSAGRLGCRLYGPRCVYRDKRVAALLFAGMFRPLTV
jgi:hypothetical protein